jgi:hypothetical protein
LDTRNNIERPLVEYTFLIVVVVAFGLMLGHNKLNMVTEGSIFLN